MKNEAEEKAIAFVRELQREELTNSNHSGFYILPELLGVAHKSFISGYEEAVRWRDPKEEPPPTPRSLGKTMYRVVVTTGGDYDPTLDTVCEYPDGGGIYFVVYRDKVTGWKPIEQEQRI